MRLGVVLLACAGCSWIAVTAPASPDAPGDCTTSVAAPVADGAIAAAAVTLGTVVLIGAEQDKDGLVQSLHQAFGGALIVTGAIYAISSISGATRVAACRAAIRH